MWAVDLSSFKVRKLLRLGRYVIAFVLLLWLVRGVTAEQWSIVRNEFQVRQFLMPTFLTATALAMNVIRWKWLLAAVGVRIDLSSATKLGCIGYASAFFSIGTLGGDVLKASLLAKQLRGRGKDVFVATAIDRIMGLYSLSILAGLCFCGTHYFSSQELHQQLIAIGYLASGAVIIGTPLMVAFRATQISLRGYVRAVAISLVSQSMIVASVYSIASRIHRTEVLPSFIDHFILVPVALLAAAAPFSPGGIGIFEVTLDWMYTISVTASPLPSGVLVGFAFNLVKLLLAAAAISLYFVLGSFSSVGGSTIRAKSACENQYFET